ncbi:MAG: hypothetical protein M1823_007883, partial [Watsoniomyces obsoletus]
FTNRQPRSSQRWRQRGPRCLVGKERHRCRGKTIVAWPESFDASDPRASSSPGAGIGSSPGLCAVVLRGVVRRSQCRCCRRSRRFGCQGCTQRGGRRRTRTYVCLCRGMRQARPGQGSRQCQR